MEATNILKKLQDNAEFNVEETVIAKRADLEAALKERRETN